MNMNTDAFTGRAEAYASSRPGYPIEAMDYIYSLTPPGSVFADIGAGTGKFTVLLAHYGNDIYAIEPNAEMRRQLEITLTSYPNVKIVDGTAEATKLSNHCVDVIVCSQSIGWFDLNAFRAECIRIGKSGAIVVSIYNEMPGDNHIPNSNRLTNRQATENFFRNPIARQFSNPVCFSRKLWIQYNSSISDSPELSSAGYKEFDTEMNYIFDRDNVDGTLRIDHITSVFSERLHI
jgi:ubiquinone/menaquinone biosynthesis C-methylase UbiE